MSDKHKGLVWKIVPGIAALAFAVYGAVFLVPDINRPERYAFSGCLIEPNIIASALDFFVYWGVTAVAALCRLAAFGVFAYAFTTGLMEAACAIKKFVVNYQPSRREEKPCRRRLCFFDYEFLPKDLLIRLNNILDNHLDRRAARRADYAASRASEGNGSEKKFRKEPGKSTESRSSPPTRTKLSWGNIGRNLDDGETSWKPKKKKKSS